MSEDRVDSRDGGWRNRWRWTELFRGFWIAFDFNKLLLAACGILMMAFGWWLLAVIFVGDPPDDFGKPPYDEKNFTGENEEERLDRAWDAYKRDRRRWAIRIEAAGSADAIYPFEAGDLADTRAEYKFLVENKDKDATTDELRKAVEVIYPAPKGDVDQSTRDKRARLFQSLLLLRKPERERGRKAGTMRTWPWHENRGPNPYLMLTGQKERPWTAGQFWEWLFSDRVPVLMEPLVKLLRPIYYFLKPDIGFVNGLYFLLALLWTIGTWAFFGGAITRIASVQIAREEKITFGEAIRYTMKRLVRYMSAPLFPLIMVGFLLVVAMFFGVIHMIPWLGELVDGLLWLVMIALGLTMALGLVGLVGWPLMSASISADGADSWESVNRSYSYIFQAPWHYLWYTGVALLYGAVIAFFIGFMGSMTVYLGKWAMAQNPLMPRSREPSFLFVYTPTSFGWRDLLLSDVQLADGSPVVDPKTGRIIPQNYNKYLGLDPDYNKRVKELKQDDTLSGMNKFGAALVTFWVTFFFLLVLGFSYSYFWSSFTLIYFLLRRKVDDGEMDEIFFEEEDMGYAGAMAPPAGTSAPAAAEGGSRSLTVVDSPAPTPPPSEPPAAPPTPPPSEEAEAPPPPSEPEDPPPSQETEPPPSSEEEAPPQETSETDEEPKEEQKPDSEKGEGEQRT